MSMTQKRRGRPQLQQDLKNITAQRRSGMKELQALLNFAPTANLKLGRSIVSAYKDGLINSKAKARIY